MRQVGITLGRNLDAPARALLRIIDKEPEAAKRALIKAS
jgi:hypothetical protein